MRKEQCLWRRLGNFAGVRRTNIAALKSAELADVQAHQKCAHAPLDHHGSLFLGTSQALVQDLKLFGFEKDLRVR